MLVLNLILIRFVIRFLIVILLHFPNLETLVRIQMKIAIVPKVLKKKKKEQKVAMTKKVTRASD